MLSVVKAKGGGWSNQRQERLGGRKQKERADVAAHGQRKVPQLECTVGLFFSPPRNNVTEKIGNGRSASD